MKKLVCALLAVLLSLVMAGCGAAGDTSSATSTSHSPPDSTPQTGLSGDTSFRETLDGGSRALIAYFSHTGTTAGVAEEIAAQTGADVFEIVPQIPYPESYDAALDIAREEQDANARPAFIGGVEDFAAYDTFFLGYPIWYGTCPMVVFTFLEAYDLSGKTVISFCTNGGSGIALSQSDIGAACGDATIVEGLGLSGEEAAAPQSAVEAWLGQPGMPKAGGASGGAGGDTLFIRAGEYTLTATLAENSSAQVLKVLLADGPLTLDMQDYGGMEKVGELGTGLPTNDEQVTTEAGDLILYGGSRFVIYYGSCTTSVEIGISPPEIQDVDNQSDDNIMHLL